MAFGLRVNDESGVKAFDSDDFVMRTIYAATQTLSGATVTVPLPGFDPARGLVVVTFFNGNLPHYIPLPEYTVTGAYPNAAVRIERKYSGQINQAMSIWAVHYK